MLCGGVGDDTRDAAVAGVEDVVPCAGEKKEEVGEDQSAIGPSRADAWEDQVRTFQFEDLCDLRHFSEGDLEAVGVDVLAQVLVQEIGVVRRDFRDLDERAAPSADGAIQRLETKNDWVVPRAKSMFICMLALLTGTHGNTHADRQ